MNQVGTTVALNAELATKPVLELDAIYRDHAPTVSKWVRRLWGPDQRGMVDAEDLLQEVFVVVQRRLHAFRGDSALTTWLYSITVLVVNARRKKERWRRFLWRRAEPELALESTEPASADYARGEACRVVYSVLDQLAERDRTLLILFELERLSGAEVAAIVGVSEPNLWVALSRARARFKKIFVRSYGDADDTGANHGNA